MTTFRCVTINPKYLTFHISETKRFINFTITWYFPIFSLQDMKYLVVCINFDNNFNSGKLLAALIYGVKKNKSFVLFLKSICALHSVLQMHWIIHYVQCNLFITTLCVSSIVSEHHEKFTIPPTPPNPTQVPWSVIKHISIAELYVVFQFISRVLCQNYVFGFKSPSHALGWL